MADLLKPFGSSWGQTVLLRVLAQLGHHSREDGFEVCTRRLGSHSESDDGHKQQLGSSGTGCGYDNGCVPGGCELLWVRVESLQRLMIGERGAGR